VFVAVFSTVAALALGFGAIQEFIIRGLRNGEVQPGIVGVAAAIVSVMILVSGIAYVRRARVARTLCLTTGTVSLLVHGYAAIPPHFNVGRLALLVAVASALVLIGAALRTPRTDTAEAAS
jgi:hypothetical protein